jgi:hypothetical protein
MQTSLAAWLSATNQWQLCGWTGTQTQRTECSVDLGKTWKAAPSFTTTTSCGACGNGGTPVSSTTPCDPNAIQPDGSLVAVCLASGTAATAQRDVYLLPPGASAWETVGSAPGGFLALTDGGQLWCIDPAGRIAETQLPA